MSLKIIAVVACAIVSTGCAFTPQTASINPEVVVAQENVGQGTEVAFRLTDDRASRSLGHRGAALIGKGAEIKAEEDVAAVLHGKITEGLERKGFRVVPYADDAPNKLTVELREFNYSTSTGFWTGGVKVIAAMKAASINKGRSFDQMYRSENEDRVVFVPGAKSNEAKLNTAVRELVEQMFSDVGLLRHLAGN